MLDEESSQDSQAEHDAAIKELQKMLDHLGKQNTELTAKNK